MQIDPIMENCVYALHNLWGIISTHTMVTVLLFAINVWHDFHVSQ